ncbi:MAG: AraC family transcriptional regulator [Melioribacteraceae bacterium]|nr:AraC family transcriptional regulator [Melioribacteraceae bacterium]
MKLRYNYFAQSVMRLLKTKGATSKQIYSAIGIPEEMKTVLDFELSVENIHYLTLFAKTNLEIEHCGLKAAQFVDFQNSGFFGLYALSCPKLKDAVFRIYSVHKKFNKLFDYEMSPSENPSRFVYNLDAYWEMKYPETANEIIEFAIANGVLSSRKLTKQNICPEKIGFKHQKPHDISLYEDLFGCPVLFNESTNFALYPSKIMDYIIPTYNPSLLKILDEFSKKATQENETPENFISEVRNIIIKLYNHNSIPKESNVAQQLNISKSYLQKKLYKEGTNYKQILSRIQKEIAMRYLQDKNVSLKEIAWILGYNDVSNFYRAFKMWTGKNPGDFSKK